MPAFLGGKNPWKLNEYKIIVALVEPFFFLIKRGKKIHPCICFFHQNFPGGSFDKNSYSAVPWMKQYLTFSLISWEARASLSPTRQSSRLQSFSVTTPHITQSSLNCFWASLMHAIRDATRVTIICAWVNISSNCKTDIVFSTWRQQWSNRKMK